GTVMNIAGLRRDNVHSLVGAVRRVPRNDAHVLGRDIRHLSGSLAVAYPLALPSVPQVIRKNPTQGPMPNTISASICSMGSPYFEFLSKIYTLANGFGLVNAYALTEPHLAVDFPPGKLPLVHEPAGTT